MTKKSLLSALPACILAAASLSASASTFGIQYFLGTTGSPDFYNGNNVPLGVSNNYVTSTLGPDGLPVFNPGFTATSGTVNAPNAAYLNASNELLYWTPGAGPAGATIQADGSGTINLSANPVTMYPPNTTSDSANELTAIITGSFTVASGTTDTVTFTVGADDTAYVYVDGNLVESLGGIHGDTPAPSNTVTYTAGTHNIEVFYADRDVTQANLSFTDNGNLTIIPTSVTPEPSSLVLLGSGLVGAAGALRRRLSL